MTADRADNLLKGIVGKRLTYQHNWSRGIRGMPKEEGARRRKRSKASGSEGPIAERLVDAGELNPTEADKALERLVRKQSH